MERGERDRGGGRETGEGGERQGRGYYLTGCSGSPNSAFLSFSTTGITLLGFRV